MAGSATVALNAVLSGLPLGQMAITPPPLTSANANGQVQGVILAAGVNTITVPATPAPNGVIVVLNPANTSVVTVKGVGGDTGIAIGKVGWFVLPFDPTAVP